MKKLLFPIIIVVVTVLSGCSSDDNVVKPLEKDYLTLWNPCEAVTALQDYVEDVTNPSSKNFIKKEDRIVTFDMDGTFVGELYPTYFEYNMLEERVLEDASYKDKAPDDVKETAQEIRDFVRNGKALPSHFDMKHARAAAKAYAGMTVAEFDAYVKAYAAEASQRFQWHDLRPEFLQTHASGVRLPEGEWFYVLRRFRLRPFYLQGAGGIDRY